MNETLATYQLDSKPVAELKKRYALGRTQFYERANGLGLEFEKRGNRAIASAAQIDLLDALHDYLKTPGNTIAGFVESLGSEPSSNELAITDPPTAIELLNSLVRIIQPQPLSDPLAHIRLLDEACEKGWKVSTSELCLLLKRKSIEGNEIRKYGFVCVRDGKNGVESAWLITRE